MLTTVIFRSALIALCDLAVVTAGAWILWSSSATSVVSGPAEDNLFFILVTALTLSVRHTVSRSADSVHVRSHMARVTLVTDLFLAAALFIAWQATGIYYLGWLTTFALMFFVIGTGFQLLVDVVTSRNRKVSGSQNAPRSRKKVSFATELTRLVGIVGAVIGFAYMSPVHGWDIAFINPLIMMLVVAIGLSVVPAALAHTGVVARSSLADDLNFTQAERDTPEEAEAPSTARSNSTIGTDGTLSARARRA